MYIYVIMPRKAGTKKKNYTQAEKLEYYKKKAARGYKGYGAYSAEAPKSRRVGEQIGQGLGELTRFIPGVGALAPHISQLTKKIGGSLANKLGSYFGWGEYKVERNSLVVPEGQSPAYMHSSGATNKVQHREYICDIISSSVAGQFSLQSFMLQPGAKEIFPWLAPIALQYQKYKVLGAIVEFKSGSGDAITGANTALGEVIISTNYNTADPNFVSRNQMENTMYCSSAKPSVSFVHVIECDPKLQAQESLYVSPSVVPENTGNSTNEINWCNIQVATVGCQGTSVNLGSLYITYEIELIQPVELSDSRQPRGDLFSLAVATINNANPLGISAATPDPKNSLGGTIVSGTRYAFPPGISSGLYQVFWYIIGTSTATLTAPTPTITNGISPTMYFNDTFQRLVSPSTVITGTNMCVIFNVQVTGRNCLIDLSAGIFNSSCTLGVFSVQAVDSSFAFSAPKQKKNKKITYTDHGEIVEFVDDESLKQLTIKSEYEAQRDKCEQSGDSYMIDKLRQKLKELESHHT